MSDSKMVSVPRELLERALKADASMGANAIQLCNGWEAMQDIRNILAAPAEDVHAADEPVAIVCGSKVQWLPSAGKIPDRSPLFIHAKRETVMPERLTLRDVIANVIGSDAYDCVRVWSAWGVGTMSEDDFVPINNQEDRLIEIVDACLDEFKRLNP